MRQRTTAEVRLDQGKAASSGAVRPSDSQFWPPPGRLRSNFVAARLDEPENHAQQPGNPGNVGLYGPQAALIAECFTPRLRYSGCSIGYQLASVTAGGPAPLIATTGSRYAIAVYILFCAIVTIVATAQMPDYTNRDISEELV